MLKVRRYKTKTNNSWPTSFVWLYLFFIVSSFVQLARAQENQDGQLSQTDRHHLKSNDAAFSESVASLTEGCAATLDQDKGYLHKAARIGDVDSINTLLDLGFDIEKLVDGITPLVEAVLSNQAESVRALVARGANTNVILPDDAKTPLIWLIAKSKYVDLAAILIDAGVTLTRDEDGTTLLMKAAMRGSVMMVESLLKRNVDPDEIMHRSEERFTAIYWLLVMDDIPTKRKSVILKRLLSAGANLQHDLYQGVTYLHDMARLGRVKEIQLLLAAGMPVDIVLKGSKTAETPLMFAIIYRELAAAAVLVTALADVNYNPNDKLTPLSMAIGGNDPAMVILLLKAGALFDDVNDFQALRSNSHEAYRVVKEYAENYGARPYSRFIRP